MSKLSHIDEVEQRNQAAAQAQEAAAQAQEPASADPVPQATTSQPAPNPQPAAHELPAEEDEEFHGIDSTKPMGALHKTLIVVAAVVVVVAILYIVNSWIHFI